MSIATEITRLQTAKADLKTAIEGKGVTVPSATKIDGYASLVSSIPSGGGGDIGGLAEMVDVDTQNYEFGYMLTCMKNGNTVGGTVNFTTAFANTETKILETGLQAIHGILFVDYSCGAGTTFNNQTNNVIFIFVDSSETLNMVGIGQSNSLRAWNYEQGTVMNNLPLNGAVRFSGGDMYVTGRYNKNANYQMLKVNTNYEWLAW